MKTKQQAVTRKIGINHPGPRTQLSLLGGIGMALPLLLLFGDLDHACAATDVCGPISGQVWTKVGSPYHVTCDLDVNSLTITEGVLVIFEGNHVFRVNGRLSAMGTENEPIVFTGTACWQGIHFNGQIQASRLTNCRIEGACNSGIRIVNASPLIEDCIITDNTAQRGGGVFVTLTQGHTPTLTNCWITSNSSTNNGGGVYASLATGTLTFSRCNISGNTLNSRCVAGDFEGGGICRETIGGLMVLDRCPVYDNTNRSRCTSGGCLEENRGGGIYSAGDLILRNCDFIGNQLIASEADGNGSTGTSHAYGGAIYQTAGSLYAVNCLFVGNVSDATGTSPTARGSAIYLNSGNGAVVNCTVIYGNEGATAVYGAGGTLTVTNSILYYNNPSDLLCGPQVGGNVYITYSDVMNGGETNGNIDFNPIFLNGDCRPYVLDPTISPCIDAGDPDPVHNDVCFCGNVSLGGVRSDMGAYGGPGACAFCCEGPRIVAQPKRQRGCLGQGATFCVAAAGTSPLSYQWWFNGAPLQGQMSSCLVLTNLQTTDAGTYWVVVSNMFGTGTRARHSSWQFLLPAWIFVCMLA